VTVTVTQGALRAGECHKLDVVVSASFFERDEPALFERTGAYLGCASRGWPGCARPRR
jgi:hypothetical protein